MADTKLELMMTRDFDAPAERVFDAWLGKDWGEFVGPREVRGEVVAIDPKIGGRYRIVMHLPDGETLTVGGIYRVIDRPRKIAFTWKWEHEETDTLVTLTFQPQGSGTRLTLHHEGFAAVERRDSHNGGWTSTLEKLGKYLAK